MNMLLLFSGLILLLSSCFIIISGILEREYENFTHIMQELISFTMLIILVICILCGYIMICLSLKGLIL